VPKPVEIGGCGLSDPWPRVSRVRWQHVCEVRSSRVERSRMEQTCTKVLARHLLTVRLVCCLFDRMNALFLTLCWDLFIVSDCECVRCHPVMFIKCVRLPVKAVSIFTVFTLKCNVHPAISIVSPSPKHNP